MKDTILKPTKTFRLSSKTKTIMASITDKTARDSFKSAMIDAELSASIVPKREPRRDGAGAAPRSGTPYTSTGNAATPS
jgi:hypothetical protein